MKFALTQERLSLKTKTHLRALSSDEFLTTRELMHLLKIRHKQTIYGLIGEGLPAVLVGRSYRFFRSEVIQFLKQCRNHKRRRQIS